MDCFEKIKRKTDLLYLKAFLIVKINKDKKKIEGGDWYKRKLKEIERELKNLD